MKILIISMVLPFPLKAGGRIRVYNLIKRLSKRHTIHLLCLADSREDIGYAEELRRFCDRVDVVVLRPGRFWLFFRVIRNIFLFLKGMPLVVINKRSDRMMKMVKELIAKGDFDCLQFEWLQMAQYVPDDSEALIRDKGVLVEHDVAYLPLERRAWIYKGLRGWFWSMEYRRMLRFERDITERFREVVAMSEEDRTRLFSLNQNLRIKVVPNGVDCGHYSIRKADKEPQTILFTGWMRHDPNVDGIVFFLKEIFPLIRDRNPDVKLFVAGGGLPHHVEMLAGGYGDSVVLTGYVEDIRELLNRACVSIVPLRIGGGTRLKILESMAAGTAVVSTSVGCEGLDVMPGEHLYVADDPNDFADRVLFLLRDDAERKRIEENALSLVKERYDWDIIASKMEEVYAEI